MLDIGIGAAFLAGLLSFVSPCVLPIVPPYLAYLAGLSFSQLEDDHISTEASRRLVLCSLTFVAGFSTVFVALGATASVIGQTLSQYFDILSILAGSIIIIMGLHFFGVFRIGFLYKEARINSESKPTGYIGSYVMGLAFAFGWTPCVGPVLAAILFVDGSTETILRGAVLLAVYSLGIGLPFVLFAAFASKILPWLNRFKKHMATVEKLMGGMLIVTGVLFITGTMSAIAQWLLDTFPIFQTIG